MDYCLISRASIFGTPLAGAVFGLDTQIDHLFKASDKLCEYEKSLDENAQALMIALYIAMDSFGTACNVTGDGALALLIDKWFGKSKTLKK